MNTMVLAGDGLLHNLSKLQLVHPLVVVPFDFVVAVVRLLVHEMVVSVEVQKNLLL